MENKNKAVWGTRFNNRTSKIFENIGASIDVDKRLFEEDIFASIIHNRFFRPFMEYFIIFYFYNSLSDSIFI